MNSFNTLLYILLSWMVVTAQNGQVTPMVHFCGLCGKTFKTGKALSCHHNSHGSPHIPFHCEDCGTGFTRQDNLTRHRKRKHAVQAGDGKAPRIAPTTPTLNSPPPTTSALNHACKVCPVYMYGIISMLYIIVSFFTHSGP